MTGFCTLKILIRLVGVRRGIISSVNWWLVNASFVSFVQLKSDLVARRIIGVAVVEEPRPVTNHSVMLFQVHFLAGTKHRGSINLGANLPDLAGMLLGPRQNGMFCGRLVPKKSNQWIYGLATYVRG